MKILRENLVPMGLGALFVALMIFSFSPLRIGTDSYRLFMMALPAACGGAYGVDQFPPFYPHLLCGLMKLGWCNGVVLYGINFLAFGIALLILREVLRLAGATRKETIGVILLIMVNWSAAKHLLLPQTDIVLLPFFWGTILSLQKCCRASKISWKVCWLFISLVLSVVAVSVRIAAVALFGLIAVVTLGLRWDNLLGLFRRRAFWLLFGGILLLAVLGFWIAVCFTDFAAEGGYLRAFVGSLSRTGSDGVLAFVDDHFYDLFQCVFNVPGLLVPHSAIVVLSIVFGIGILALLVVSFGHSDFPLYVIVVGYGLELFLWPFLDPRFFLPILPFVLLMIIRLMGRAQRCRTLLSGCFVSFGVLLGSLAWGRLAMQWTWGTSFYRHTSWPSLTTAYQNAQTKSISEVPPEERTLAFFILKAFDPLHSFPDQQKLTFSDYRNYIDKW